MPASSTNTTCVGLFMIYPDLTQQQVNQELQQFHVDAAKFTYIFTLFSNAQRASINLKRLVQLNKFSAVVVLEPYLRTRPDYTGSLFTPRFLKLLTYIYTNHATLIHLPGMLAKFRVPDFEGQDTAIPTAWEQTAH
ncbi:hypothetical protein MD484_g2612, partial [Candolleomyces efflorescens]